LQSGTELADVSAKLNLVSTPAAVCDCIFYARNRAHLSQMTPDLSSPPATFSSSRIATGASPSDRSCRRINCPDVATADGDERFGRKKRRRHASRAVGFHASVPHHAPVAKHLRCYGNRCHENNQQPDTGVDRIDIHASVHT